MAKLVSMKISKAEREKMNKPMALVGDAGPAYPWGLSVNLDQDSLEKLDLDANDLKVGKTLTLIATVEVTNLSSNESKDGGSNQSVGLQITAMCLETGKKGAAEELYPEKKKSA